jgi:hypothetical protein
MSSTQRLRALVAKKFKRLEERQFAKRVCSESLAAYHAIRNLHPQLKGDALYEAVVAKRSSIDAAAAKAIISGVNISVDDWVSNRNAMFRDVVRYMIVTEYLRQDIANQGMEMDLGPFLAKRIDAHY